MAVIMVKARENCFAAKRGSEEWKMASGKNVKEKNVKEENVKEKNKKKGKKYKII